MGLIAGVVYAVASAIIIRLVAGELDTAVVGGVAGGIAAAAAVATVGRMRGTGGDV